MPAKDNFHDPMKRALIKDGWNVEIEQATFITANRQIVVDIQASHSDLSRIILVEVKGFERSPMEHLAISIGKLQIYRFMINELDLQYELWLAVPEAANQGIFKEKIGLVMRDQNKIDLLVFSPVKEEIVEWIPYEKS